MISGAKVADYILSRKKNTIGKDIFSVFAQSFNIVYQFMDRKEVVLMQDGAL